MIQYNSLARSYNVLDNSFAIRNLLTSFFNDNKFEKFNKREMHEYINQVLLKNHAGEEVLKYVLTKYFIKKNVIAAYEVNTLNSRADFITINGDTKSFEIKSDIDSLLRVKKQSLDYSKVFEYNYVVVGSKYVDKMADLLPEHMGIWMITKRNALKKIRQATLSPHISKACQLDLLNKKELNTFFGSNKKESIVNIFSDEEINQLFKDCLKKRYKKRWHFLKENYQNIYPLNYQFFFNSNIKPNIVYDSI